MAEGPRQAQRRREQQYNGFRHFLRPGSAAASGLLQINKCIFRTGFGVYRGIAPLHRRSFRNPCGFRSFLTGRQSRPPCNAMQQNAKDTGT